MHATAASPIPASKSVEYAGGVRGPDELTPFSKADFEALGLNWDDFFAKARANCANDLAALKPRYERNKKKVIEYAVLESPEPFVASAVLAPKFLELFADTLGPKVLVVMPNQFTAYVFPALVSNYKDYAPMVREAYRATAHPVSMEVFEFGPDGVKAVGVYEEP